jgi:NADP-dependent aldehyde dehydrogenase
MEITGHLLIGSRSQFGSGGEFQGINAASGEPIEPIFGGAVDQIGLGGLSV